MTLPARIFAAKSDSDFEKTAVVSFMAKFLAAVALLAVNVLFRYYSLLLGFSKDYEWQVGGLKNRLGGFFEAW